VAQRNAASEGWIENRPSTGGLPSLRLAEAWNYRELAGALALRDLQLRYKQTVFGVAWAIIQPLLAAAIFTLVFGRWGNLPSDGIDYAPFVLTGLAAWFYFASSLEAAAQSLVDNQELVTKVYFPRLLAPLAAVLPGLIDLIFSLVIVGAFIAAYGISPSLALVAVPLWIGAAVLVAFGAGVWLAALNVLYRDVRYTLVFLIQLWLFASPVVFPASIVPESWQPLFFANPMAGVIEGFRWSLLDGPAPPPEALISAAVAVFFILGGIAYFQRVERRLADRI
jgi:lipopolysaccharide transport system permease protein